MKTKRQACKCPKAFCQCNVLIVSLFVPLILGIGVVRVYSNLGLLNYLSDIGRRADVSNTFAVWMTKMLCLFIISAHYVLYYI